MVMHIVCKTISEWFYSLICFVYIFVTVTQLAIKNQTHIPAILPEIRCTNVVVVNGSSRVCNGLLFKGVVLIAEAMCKKCGHVNHITKTKIA